MERTLRRDAVGQARSEEWNSESSSATATVPGAQSGDSVVLQPTAGIWGGLIWAPWLVNAANSVELRLCNPGTVAFDGSAVTFQVLLIR